MKVRAMPVAIAEVAVVQVVAAVAEVENAEALVASADLVEVWAGFSAVAPPGIATT